MLTKEEALWADHMLSTDAAGLRKRAVALRSQGRRHLPLKKAATYVAEACDRAAIELERARKQISNQGAEA